MLRHTDLKRKNEKMIQKSVFKDSKITKKL